MMAKLTKTSALKAHETGSFTIALGGKEFECSPEDFGDTVREIFTWHGMAQKLGDFFAGWQKRYDSEELAWAGFLELVERLENDEWLAGRSGTGVSDLQKAIAEVRNVSLEDAKAALDRITGDEDQIREKLAKLRKHPQIAVVLARLKAERAEERRQKLEAEAAKGMDEAPDIDSLFV